VAQISPSWRTVVGGRFFAAIAGLLLAMPTGPARAVDITACGQTVPDGEIGVLQVDLVCPSGDGIVMGARTDLQLNGHTIAAETPTEGQVAIACSRGSCRIQGPGTVSGFKGVAIAGLNRSRLEISDVDLHDNGVAIDGHRVTLTNVGLSANEDWGASGRHLVATNVTAVGNLGEGIAGRTIRCIDVVASDNGRDGVRANRLNAERLTATGNGGYGVQSIYPGRTRLEDSTVTGNATADVGSQRAPVLRVTSCGTSRRLSEAGADLGTWGVCDSD
jgi:hypothetical protein